MKLRFALATLVSMIAAGCGQTTTMKDKVSKSGAMTAEEQAANSLYLDDVQDSSTDESSDDTATTTDTSSDEASTVEEDVCDRRLDQMANMMFDQLDTDDSGSLSLEEFLVGPAKREEDKKISEDELAKIQEKMTADFETYAGDDNELSQDELITLLKEAAPRVGHFRHKKFGGKQDERVKKSWEDIVAAYDTDGDGKLSQEEFEAYQQASEKVMKHWDEKRPRRKGPPHGEGKGPRPEDQDQPASDEAASDSEG